MKKAIVIFLSAITLYSCAKRITSNKIATNSSEVKVNDPLQPATPPMSEVKTVAAPVVVDLKDMPEPKIKKESIEVAAGKETFKAKCGSCHELKPAETYTSAKWVKIIDWMAPKAKLNASEKENVLAYVSFYAKTES